eukprot:3631492-Rhodomonas_salina.2
MRSILGSLQYLQLWSRPEISFSVNYLARYTLRADKTTITAARRILRYLASTKEKGIWFQYNPSMQLGRNAVKVYADTSDADCQTTSKSTGGYIIKINDAPIVWKSGRLPLVTLSSAE